MKQTALQDSTERPPGSAALLPCPFCGQDDSLLAYHNPKTILHPWYRIECDYCGAKGPGSDRGDHVEQWNARAPEPPGGAAAPPSARTPEPDKQDQGVERAALREALERIDALNQDALTDAVRSHLLYEASWIARAALAAHPGVV